MVAANPVGLTVHGDHGTNWRACAVLFIREIPTNTHAKLHGFPSS